MKHFIVDLEQLLLFNVLTSQWKTKRGKKMMRPKLQTMGWIAALLLFSALLCTAPTMAEEVKYQLWIAGKQVTSENCQNIDKDHGFEGVTIAEGGECRYDKEKNTLFMTGVTIAPGNNKSAIANYIEHLIIKVAGKNRWNTTNRAAIYNSGLESTIKGEEGQASLEVTSTDSAAVFVNYTLGVKDIDFSAKGKWGVLGKDPNDRGCNFSIRTAKGKVTATSTQEEVSAIMNLWGLNDQDMLTVKPKGSMYYSDSKAFLDTEGKKVKEVEFDRKYVLYIGKNAQVDAENYKDLTKDPKFKEVKVGEEGHLRYDPKTKTLFMKDVTIKTDNSSLETTVHNAIISDVDGLTIKMEGENSFEVKEDVITCSFPIHITGNGSLTLKNNEKYGIMINDNIYCSNITVEISDITLSVETAEGFMWNRSSQSTKYILNNVKATVRGPFSNTDLEFKGCKIVSANGASPVEIDRIRVESVAFNPKEITRYVGDAPEALPMPTISPDNAGNKKLAWTSDKEEVAKVEDGKLIIGTKGTAHLTAKATDGSNKEDQLTVQVRYHVDGVKLYQGTKEVAALTLTEGEAVTLAAKIAPESTPDEVEWVCQESEFSVKDKTTEKATFTALKAGDYTIIAKALQDSEKTATVNVKVLPKVASLSLYEKNKTEAIGDALTFEIGESKTFEVKQLPSEALPLLVTWSVTVGGKPTENVTVAEGVVTVKKWVEGCVLTISVSETVQKKVTLTVLKPAPKEIKLTPKELTLAAVETKELIISFVGDEPLDEGVTIQPATSEYFTVKQEGKKLSITATKPTTEALTLTVTSTRNTTVKDSCKVTVTKALPTTISIAEKDKAFDLKKDESKEIALSFTPTDYVDNEVTVTVQPEGALSATVADGKLTLKADKPFDKETTVMVTVTSKAAPTVANSCTVTLKTGIGGAVEDTLLASIRVAPNPFTTYLQLVNPEGVQGLYEVLNAAGVVVRAGAVDASEVIVNTETLPAGVYFVRVNHENGAQRTLKVVKL